MEGLRANAGLYHPVPQLLLRVPIPVVRSGGVGRVRSVMASTRAGECGTGYLIGRTVKVVRGRVRR